MPTAAATVAGRKRPTRKPSSEHARREAEFGGAQPRQDRYRVTDNRSAAGRRPAGAARRAAPAGPVRPTASSRTAAPAGPVRPTASSRTAAPAAPRGLEFEAPRAPQRRRAAASTTTADPAPLRFEPQPQRTRVRTRVRTAEPRAPRTRTETRRQIHRPSLRRPALALPSPGTLVDSIIRGRVWIPMLCAMLLAIVAMRVEVLKDGASLGTSDQLASQLQSENAALQGKVAVLSGPERIERLAKKMGMGMPGPRDVSFVTASSGHHIAKAEAAISSPDADSFLTALAGDQIDHGEPTQAAATENLISSSGGTDTTASTTDTSVADTTTAATTTTADTGGVADTTADTGTVSDVSTVSTAATSDTSTGNTGAAATGNTGTAADPASSGGASLAG